LKIERALLGVVMILCLALMANSAFAQSTQISYNVNLSAFSLQVTYPSQVKPGDTVSVNVQVSPKTSVAYLQSLTATVYYADSSGLHSVTNQTLVTNNAFGYGNYVTSGFSKSFTFNVPAGAPRTSLVAVFTETSQTNNYYTYYGYGPYYNSYYSSSQYWGYPYYYSSTASDDAIAPLSYIQASTPEYVALQSTYQMLQQQLNQTQAQLTQSKAQQQQSQAQNQQLQNTVAQQSSTISQLNQQLAGATGTMQTYQMLTIALGIIALIFAVFGVYEWRTKSKPENSPGTQSVPTKTQETQNSTDS
jgi:hypothetical protein